MKCIRCDKEMKLVTMTGDVYGTPISLSYKKKGIFETRKDSRLECYVCTQCGYVELKAENPKIFEIVDEK